MEYSFQSRFKFLLDKINREMAGVKNSEVLRGQQKFEKTSLYFDFKKSKQK